MGKRKVFGVSCLGDFNYGFVDFHGPDFLYVEGDLVCRHITIPKLYVEGNVMCQNIICASCYIGGNCNAETVNIYNDATFKGALNVYDLHVEGDLFTFSDIFCANSPITVRGDIFLQ